MPAAATATLYTVTAGLNDAASLDQPDRIKPVERNLEYRPDLTIDLQPYTVAVIEIQAQRPAVPPSAPGSPAPH